VDAARLLARAVGQLNSARELEPSERDRRARIHAGRAALLLREAIDIDPKLAEPLKADADIRQLAPRPEFRELLKSVIRFGP
jgi:hypothetical protein